MLVHSQAGPSKNQVVLTVNQKKVQIKGSQKHEHSGSDIMSLNVVGEKK